MTEVNYHLADLSEAALQVSVTHRPPLTIHQQLQTPAQPDRKTLDTEYMTGSPYTRITSTCSYSGEIPLIFTPISARH